MSEVVLGIHGYSATDDARLHDSSAALVIDGRIVAAVSEERLSRVKCDGSFPNRAIREVLDIGGITPRDVTAVAMADFNVPRYALRAFRYNLQTLFETGVFLPRRALGPFKDALVHPRRAPLEFRHATVRYVEHHTAHAAAAYLAGPFDPALIITMDGVGDELCATVSEGSGGNVRRLYGCNGLYSPGMLYSAVTQALGFTRNRHEGKISGLAAYGDPCVCLAEFDGQFAYNPRSHSFCSGDLARLFRRVEVPRKRICALVDKHSPEHVAAAVQHVIEQLVLDLVRDALSRSSVRNIVLAGGVFANVRLNQLIRELPEVENVFIHPDMGDSGLGLGAALYTARRDGSNQSPRPLETVYLGPGWSGREIERAIHGAGLRYRVVRPIEPLIADRLARGRIVGRFAGRLEYGPRALGNRSILAPATDATVNDWLNRRLHRTEFMPFAPAILRERAAEYLVGWQPDHDAARFMTTTYRVTQTMQKQAPAVVHVDGTARPQVVDEKDNPSLHRVLREYEQRTGLPVLVNTSFNIHEEPIVCTPEDAIAAYRQGSVDCLAAGNCWTEREETT